MKRFWIFLIFITIILFLTNSAFAGWLIFHRPAFKGRVIDADTKEPIQGAVVVAVYQKHPMISGPAGGSSSIIKIKETLTDEKGEFFLSSYTTIIQPLAMEWDTEFIIYKPGYGKYPSHRASPSHVINQEELFSKQIGTQGAIQVRAKAVSFIYGVVELPRLKTWEERNRANMISISVIPKNKWPQLHDVIEKEEEWLRRNKGWRR